MESVQRRGARVPMESGRRRDVHGPMESGRRRGLRVPVEPGGRGGACGGARSLVVVAALLSILGCSDAQTTRPPENPYLPRTSPQNVIENLEISYRRRDPAGYAELLADDFRFFIDEQTREEHPELPPFITRFEDSTMTANLFLSPKVIRIKIDLTYENPRPATEPGRETWLCVDVPDTYLEVEQRPEPGEEEGVTLRVDGQPQRFYFRKGRTPADTLAASPTAGLYYFVEWTDFGVGSSAAGISRSPAWPHRVPREAAVETVTWSRIKTLF